MAVPANDVQSGRAVKRRSPVMLKALAPSAIARADEPRRRAAPGVFPSRDASTAPAVRRDKQALALVEILGLIGLPSAVLSPSCAVLAANRLFVTSMPGLFGDLRSGPRSNRTAGLIAETVAEFDSGGKFGSLHSIPLRAKGGKPPAILQLIALRALGVGVFPGAAAILIVIPVLPRPVPNPEILRGLFGLSPAEARVARGIATRQTIDVIADRCGVSRETVRSQLKTVLAKTGTKRQVDLAVLLAGLRLGKS
jgi:DNA-binding CsgD family transcriptional regulator